MFTTVHEAQDSFSYDQLIVSISFKMDSSFYDNINIPKTTEQSKKSMNKTQKAKRKTFNLYFNTHTHTQIHTHTHTHALSYI